MRLRQHFGHGGEPRRSPRRTTPAEGRWLYRQVRGLRPDRNPLRRRTDRVESYLLAGMFVAAAAGAPLAAQAASHAAYDSARLVQQQQLSSRYQVEAVLTQRAGAAVSGYTLSANVPAKATWTSVNGVHRSGEILARTGSAAGTMVTIWTDADGNLTSPPLASTQVTGQADAAGLGAVMGVIVVFVAGAGTTRYLFYRRRMAAWEADWLTTARTWNRQSW